MVDFLDISSEVQKIESNELIPPSGIKIETIGDPNTVPLDLSIDKEKLEKLLDYEGVSGGGSLRIVLEYPEKGDIESPNPIKRLMEKVKTGFPYGQYEWNKRVGHIVKVNAYSQYLLAQMVNLTTGKDIEQIYKGGVAAVLSHEIGHSREPREMLTDNPDPSIAIKKSSYIKKVGTAFVFIDAGRRIKVPWVGALEPALMGVEAGVAEGFVRTLSYSNKPAEKFAREHSSTATNLWKSVLVVDGKKENNKYEVRT